MVDLDSGIGQIRGEEVRLTEKERALLDWMAAHPDENISRDALLERVWGYAPGVRSRTVDTTVRRLRQKLERDDKNPRHLLTAHGVGYRFSPLDDARQPVAAGGPRTNFIHPSGEMFGRAEELKQIQRWWAGPERLLSLVGPPGAGKTRLAEAAVAQILDDDLRAQAWVLSAVGAEQPQALAQALAAALQMSPPPPNKAVAATAVILQQRPQTLLVLDNFETLLPEGVHLVERWLSAAPTLKILVTSRRALDSRFEHRVVLAGLPEEDAVALLQSHSNEGTPDQPLRQIAAQLDRIPLAMSLCGMRIRWQGAQAVADALREGGVGGLHLDPLFQAVERSWTLLEPDEQNVLAHLSVFRGGFTVEHAAAVLPPGQRRQLPGALDQLRRGSLLKRGERPGRMGLYESIRAYAADRLADDPDQERAAQARHCALWLQPFPDDPFSGAEENRWIPELALESANIRQALATATGDEAGRLALLAGIQLRRSGNQVDCVALIDDVLQQKMHPAIAARLRMYRSRLTLSEARTADTAADLDAARTIFRAHHREDWSAVVELYEGERRWACGDGERGLALMDRGLEVLRDSEWSVFVGTTAHQFAYANILRRRIGDARVALELLITRAVMSADPLLDYFVATTEGSLAWAVGRLSESVEWSRRALRIAERHGYARYAARTRGTMVFRHEGSGEYDEAARLAEALLLRLSQEGSETRHWNLTCNLAFARLGQGRSLEARALFRRLVARARQAGVDPQRGEALRGLGFAHALAGNDRDAYESLSEAAAALERSRISVPYGECCAKLAIVTHRLGDDPDPWLAIAERTLRDVPFGPERLALTRAALGRAPMPETIPKALTRFARLVTPGAPIAAGP
ncbi:MAG: winged helix-turn-helix domain-containing protein [Myxococcota bacterium]